MALTIYPIGDEFAAEVGDVDLSQPLTQETETEIKRALTRYAVLVFPEQDLTADQHIAFARRFGELEISKQLTRRTAGEMRIREELADTSNLGHDDKPFAEHSRQRFDRLANMLWHSDSSFKHVPAYASLLYSRTVAPIGGHTEFADMRAALHALPPDVQERIRTMRVEHWYLHSRAKMGFADFLPEEAEKVPPVLQVLVRTLPDTGKRALYLSSHAGRIIDLPDEESRQLLEHLTRHATQRQFVYTHRWRVKDLVVWDNRCTMHRGTAFDDLRWKRDIQRATVADCANTCEAEKQRGSTSAATANMAGQ